MAEPDRRGPAPPLADGLAHLVPTALVDPRALYELAYASGSAAWWRTRGQTVSLERFASLVTEAGDASFAVFDARHGNELAGYVGLHAQDLTSRTACVSAFFDHRRAEAPVVAGAALRLFARYVFDAVGFRKLVLEVPGSRSDYLARAAAWSEVVHHEGTLRSHTAMGAHLEDLHLYAVFAHEYLARYGSHPPAEPSSSTSALAAVRAAISTVCGDVDLSGGHRLVEDLALDSLALLEVIDALERSHPGAFHSADDLATVQDLVGAIERFDDVPPANGR